jgi:DNA uptake protein ComE-like DNA-binding protein
MSFLNIFQKGSDGKQKRIEHRGKYARLSRTGGVSLRKQAKVAGVSVTANTMQGVRVSKRIAKNTRVAVQNGRFVLQGHYDSGPARLHISKTGATVSSRNALGAFNWVKPNRSSVKIAGIQLRGKNAAGIQVVYMLFSAVFYSIKFLGLALIQAFALTIAIPSGFNALKQRVNDAQFARRLIKARVLLQPSIRNWQSTELLAAVLLILAGWGRGMRAEDAAHHIAQYLQQQPDNLLLLQSTLPVLHSSAQQLERLRAGYEDKAAGDPRVMMALLTQQLAGILSPEDTAEALLSVEELALALGARTVFQDELVQVFAEFAGLQFTALSVDKTVQKAANHPLDFVDSSVGKHPLVNLNTATLQQLQTLPHVGLGRANAITALRPINNILQLQAINGIGPARLAEIADKCFDV